MGKKKQNGFGNPKSLAFKGVESRVYKGKGAGAVGQYPSNRQFGSTVHRTIIEQYNLDSDWTRWRKGFEYYNQGAYLEFASLDTLLYQGTEDEVNVRFTGQRFATKNADTNTHYSVKREVLDTINLGTVTEVFNNRTLYPENYARHEIWAKVEDLDTESTPNKLKRAIGDRVTDGHTAANIVNVMTTKRYPSVYDGKVNPSNPARLEVKIPASTLGTDDAQALVNQVVVVENLIVERPITVSDIFIDSEYYFAVSVNNVSGASDVKILEYGATNLPPDLLDVATLTPLYEATGSYELNATYLFDKNDYQRFYGKQYMTADVVKSQVGTISYLVQPLRILGVAQEGTDLVLVCEPFVGSCQMFAKDPVGYLIFNDKSFTTQEVDSTDGVYLHTLGGPTDPLWQRLNTDVDPWMDEVFTSSNTLTFADTYSCSCPDYLHSIIRMPEARDGMNRNNRQRRIPLPSAQSRSAFDGIGPNQLGGATSTWETKDYKTSNRMCKHTVASRFTNKLKVIEPKSYPTLEAREDFEKKLEADIKEVSDEFISQLKRSEITAIEIVYVLAAGLNLNDTELASAIINSFSIG